MTPMPLRLERYFFTRLVVEANSDFAGLPASSALPEEGLDVEIRIEIFKHNTDPQRFQVVLLIDRVTAPDPGPPYQVELEVVGTFVVDLGLLRNDVERLVQINGASILYSAAREYLLMVTGRGPWGPLMLPTVSFQGHSHAHPSSPGKDEEMPVAESSHAVAGTHQGG